MLKHYSHNRVFYYFYPMKVFTYTLLVLAVALIIFNITLLDFNSLLEGESMIALIGIAASMCAIFILLIFRMSKIVQEKTNDR